MRRFLVFVCSSFLGFAAALPPADELLDNLTEEEDKGPEPGSIEKSLDLLREQPPVLPDDEAAALWLETFQDLTKKVRLRQGGNWRSRSDLESLLKALPRTSAWPNFLELIDELPEDAPKQKRLTLELFGSILLGNDTRAQELLEVLTKQIEAGDKDLAFGYRQLFWFKQIWAQNSEALDLVDVFREQLEILGKEKRGQRNSLSSIPIQVPDLTGLPEAEVEKLIEQTLQSGAGIKIESEQTKNLFAEFIVQNPEKLDKPILDLLETDWARQLFDIYAKFVADETDWQWRRARQDQVGRLLEKREFENARTLLLELIEEGEGGEVFGYEVRERLEGKVEAEELADFLEGILIEKSDPSLWNFYFRAASDCADPERGLQFGNKVREGLERSDLSYLMITRERAERLFELDRVEEGFQELGLFLELSELVKGDAEKFRVVSSELRTLAQVAGLLEEKELADRALQALEELYMRNLDLEISVYTKEEAVRALVEGGREAAAYAILENDLQLFAKGETSSYRGRSQTLTGLVWLYWRAGQHEDVLTLVRQAPFWGKFDLNELRRESFSRQALFVMVADSLRQVGEEGLAVKVLNRYFQSEVNKDAAFELLLKIQPADDVLEKLRQLAQANPFQERPLIWSAKVLMDQGKLAEAEAMIRKAIAIDPSDGEQGRGTRMYAYEVLSQVLEKQGKDEEAAKMSGAVRAVRISEKADKWWAAGMSSKALSLYQKALKEFADAYCIQSRLALRYMDAGDEQKAAFHYERAFELMPSSFGRVESHCFGCEGIFSDKLSQGIADRVFSRLVNELPENPQVHYLLGYLRQQQKEYQEAAELYQKAVELDPLYLNAWRNLHDVAGKANFSSEKRDRIALTYFRLDPESRSAREVSDLQLLWDTLIEVEKERPVQENGSLIALMNPEQGSRESLWRGQRSRNVEEPRDQFFRNNKVRALHQLLQPFTY